MAEGTLDCGGAPSQAVLTPGEACNPIQLPVATPGQNSLAWLHSTDKEVQWLSEVGRSPIQTEPPAQSQGPPHWRAPWMKCCCEAAGDRGDPTLSLSGLRPH
ncbi:unnamed protein product [Natator depressus]